MPGPLGHSPADIVRHLLIQLGHGENPTPTATPDWSIYVASEPNSPDAVVTVYDTEGRIDGTSNPDGEAQEYFGVQVRVRAEDHPTGYAKARAIADSMDRDVWRDTATVGGTSYCVQSIARTSSVLALGTDKPAGRRHLFTINALAEIRRSA